MIFLVTQNLVSIAFCSFTEVKGRFAFPLTSVKERCVVAVREKERAAPAAHFGRNANLYIGTRSWSRALLLHAF